jgi:hypothetical protein
VPWFSPPYWIDGYDIFALNRFTAVKLGALVVGAVLFVLLRLKFGGLLMAAEHSP